MIRAVGFAALCLGTVTLLGYGLVMHYEIRREEPVDIEAIAQLSDLSFGDNRGVSGLINALRARSSRAPLPTQSFVATVGGQIVGHGMISAARLDAPAKIVDVYTISPLCVHPDFRRRGIGLQLAQRRLDEAEALGVPMVFVEGDPVRNEKLGFERASGLGFRAPSLRIPDDAFQVKKLSTYESWMNGTFVYPDPFWDFDCVGLRDPELEMYLAARRKITD